MLFVHFEWRLLYLISYFDNVEPTFAVRVQSCMQKHNLSRFLIFRAWYFNWIKFSQEIIYFSSVFLENVRNEFTELLRELVIVTLANVYSTLRRCCSFYLVFCFLILECQINFCLLLYDSRLLN